MSMESTGNVRSSREIAGALRSRFRLLLAGSMLVVGIAFGTSFYFAFVSGHTAIASQIPELADVVSRLRNTLILNTVGFGAVLVASLAILARLLTARVFAPLEAIERGLDLFARGALPDVPPATADGPFASTHERYAAAVEAIRNREREELEACSALAESRPEAMTDRAAAAIERKRSLLDGAERPPAAARDTSDPLFMQPV